MAPHMSTREHITTKVFATEDFRKKPQKQKKIKQSTEKRKEVGVLCSQRTMTQMILRKVATTIIP